eukprot:15470693-Alexandrium_andersonii.AAC.1
MSVTSAARAELRESVKHFRKWTCRRFEFGKAVSEDSHYFPREQIEVMCGRGVTPWSGRPLLTPGHRPSNRLDFGFRLGDAPPY